MVSLPEHGQWSLLALQEASYNFENHTGSVSELHYAFITLDKEGKVMSRPVQNFEASLRSNEIYRPEDTAARTKLIEEFGPRMNSDSKAEKTEPRSCSLAETLEAVRLMEMYKANVEKSDIALGEIRQAMQGRY